MRIAVRTVGLALAISACTPRPKEPESRYVEDEILVRLAPGATLPAADEARVLARIQTPRSLLRIRIPREHDVEEAVRAYERLPGVLWAEPNWIIRLDAAPNDPMYVNQWALENVGQTNGTVDADVNGAAAWDVTTGDDVVLAVIDTGVEYSHADLAQNMWVNPGEIAGNGLDDDSNGYVDDVHGINAISADGDPMDDHFHGTHVAGIIAARGNNGLGVAGVNWRAKVIACKFIAANGQGTLADALTCLDYVRVLKTRASHPIDVVATNNSWGGLPFTRALHEAIAAHRDAGILFVAAAGNSASDNDVSPFHPASHYLPNVLSVASTDHVDALSSFSSYGRRSVHVGAPGSAILSTFLNDGYASVSGTSMAAPHVTGLLGLLKAQDPSRDWRALRNLVLTAGQDLPALASTTITGRRMRAADAGGVGSLACNARTISTRLRPLALGGSEVIARRGVTGVAALDIDCDSPAGGVSIAVAPTAGSIALSDDGAGFDGAAGDGIYSAEWIPDAQGSFDLSFPGADVVTMHAIDPYRSPAVLSTGMRVIAGTNLGVGDEGPVILAAPFPLRIGNHPQGFDALRVYGNGHISLFDTLSSTRFNAPLPLGSQQTVIAPFWDDLQPPTSGACGVFSAVLGTAGNRELVIEWRDVPHFPAAAGCPSASGTVTFQVVMFESDPSILFHYADVDFGDGSGPFDGGASATIGMQIGAHAVAHSFNVSSMAPGTTLLWQPGSLPVAGRPSAAAAALEGSAVTIGSSFTDDEGPWTVEWDFDYDGVVFDVDAAQSVSAAGAIASNPVFADDGAPSIGVRIRDTGGLVSSARATRIMVANVPPALGPLAAGTAREGAPLAVSGSFTDPGPDGPWTTEWDFDYDGTFAVDATDVLTAPGAIARTIVYPQDGEYTVALRIRERDGEVSGIATTQALVTAETAPGAPAIVAPTLGAVVATDAPTLVIANATDADGDALTHRFELDRSPFFSSQALLVSQELVGSTAGTTSWSVSGLDEDTEWYWRARASDGSSVGPWAASSFRVNATNAPPSAPIAIGPANDALLGSTLPTLVVADATDPDGDALTYSFVVLDSTGAQVAARTGVSEGSGSTTSWTIDAAQELAKGETYTWTATASDGTASGAPSAVASFTVYKEPKDETCGCDLEATAAMRGPGSKAVLHLAMLALAGIVVARRRRR